MFCLQIMNQVKSLKHILLFLWNDKLNIFHRLQINYFYPIKKKKIIHNQPLLLIKTKEQSHVFSFNTFNHHTKIHSTVIIITLLIHKGRWHFKVYRNKTNNKLCLVIAILIDVNSNDKKEEVFSKYLRSMLAIRNLFFVYIFL